MTGVLPPKPATLKKYGLTLEGWQELLAQQGGACFVCEKVPPRGRLCIDHHHVKGWKKLPPERRRLHVRGLLCWVCNHYYLGRGITVAKARRVVEYLARPAHATVAASTHGTPPPTPIPPVPAQRLLPP